MELPLDADVECNSTLTRTLTWYKFNSYNLILYAIELNNISLTVQIVQVNLTITNEPFQSTLYDPNSNDYVAITQSLVNEVKYVQLGCFAINLWNRGVHGHLENSRMDARLILACNFN